MTKQLSMDSLKQQLTQAERLTEAQLNNLLEALENQKTRLSQEDRLIIDWGISFVRNKMQEESQFMADLLSKFIEKYMDYTNFSRGLDFRVKGNWESFHISNDEGQFKLYSSFIDRLNELVIDTSNLEIGGYDGKSCLKPYVVTAKRHLSYFAGSINGLDHWVFNNCVKEFNSPRYQSMKHSDYYTQLALSISG